MRSYEQRSGGYRGRRLRALLAWALCQVRCEFVVSDPGRAVAHVLEGEGRVAVGTESAAAVELCPQDHRVARCVRSVHPDGARNARPGGFPSGRRLFHKPTALVPSNNFLASHRKRTRQEPLRASAGSARLICLDADRCSWRSITNNFRSVTFAKQLRRGRDRARDHRPRRRRLEGAPDPGDARRGSDGALRRGQLPALGARSARRGRRWPSGPGRRVPGNRRSDARRGRPLDRAPGRAAHPRLRRRRACAQPRPATAQLRRARDPGQRRYPVDLLRALRDDLGSRIREVHRAPGGKKIEELVEVAEYEPDRVLGLRNIEGPPVQGRITLEPTERGTRFRFRVCGQPTGATRLVEPLLRFILKRNFQHFCTTLKRVLEDAAAKA